jgi:hypothetical protein
MKRKMMMMMLTSVLIADNNKQFNSVLEVFTCWLNKVIAQLQQSRHEYAKNKQNKARKK